MTTKRNISNQIIASLEPIYGQREAMSIARLVVESLFGWSRADFLFDADNSMELTSDQWTLLGKAIDELKESRPVQYVLGESEFCGLRFKVREGVLIPRPETEELVEWIALQHKNVTVLDIGTGSGAIAIALSHVMNGENEISAIDISDEAIAIATENAKLLGANVAVSKVDILSPAEQWLQSSRYDVIVSNPPYIPQSDGAAMRDNVMNYEPHLALFVNDSDPLIFYRTIALHARRILNDSGWLYFEIYEHAAEQLMTMLERMGYANIELRCDIHEKPRMIRCQKSFQ